MWLKGGVVKRWTGVIMGGGGVVSGYMVGVVSGGSIVFRCG